MLLGQRQGFGQSYKKVAVSHDYFNLHFLVTCNTNTFLYAFFHLYIFFGEVSVKVHFSIGLFVFLLLSIKIPCMSRSTVLYQMWVCKCVLPVCGLFFHSLNSIFHRAASFHLIQVRLINSFISWLVPLVLHLESHYHTQDHLYFCLMLTSRSFIVLYFISRYRVHFGLIFFGGCKVYD